MNRGEKVSLGIKGVVGLLVLTAIICFFTGYWFYALLAAFFAIPINQLWQIADRGIAEVKAEEASRIGADTQDGEDPRSGLETTARL